MESRYIFKQDLYNHAGIELARVLVLCDGEQVDQTASVCLGPFGAPWAELQRIARKLADKHAKDQD